MTGVKLKVGVKKERNIEVTVECDSGCVTTQEEEDGKIVRSQNVTVTDKQNLKQELCRLLERFQPDCSCEYLRVIHESDDIPDKTFHSTSQYETLSSLFDRVLNTLPDDGTFYLCFESVLPCPPSFNLETTRSEWRSEMLLRTM